MARAPITVREEEDLIARAQSGDQQALGTLIEAHRGFVTKEAKRLSGPNVEMEDLVSAGIVGLIEAVRRFDPERGVRLLTFAGYHVIGRITEEAARGGPIAIPAATLARYLRAKRLATDPAEVQAIALKLGMTASAWSAVDSALASPVALDEATVTSTAPTGSVGLPPSALDGLDERAQRVVTLAYAAGFSDGEIAREMGLTRPTVQRVRASALAKLEVAA
jgi:RNA polymerase sigma factor (sigma-70 family)